MRDGEHPVCACHGELMTWQADPRLTNDGRWICRAKRRLYNQNRSAQRVAWVQNKRDRDPLYRIGDALAGRHRRALGRLARSEPNPTEEGTSGPLPDQGSSGSGLERDQAPHHDGG